MKLLLMLTFAWAFIGTSLASASNANAASKCAAAYHELYARGGAKIRVVFGYKDTRPARFVGDRHERLIFVQKILKACKSNQVACGFERDTENMDLFRKTISGPDGKPLKVNLIVANSSAGSDDVGNRENPFQKWQSAYAVKTFSNAIEKADVVLYNGHSRFGGGPDFHPPVLNAKGEVDTEHYKTKRPGLQLLQEKLKNRTALKDSEANGRLKMLGLFSCASTQLFSDELVATGQTALISSRAIIYHADALENSLAALESILGMRCENEFNASMRSILPNRGSKIEGFF